jgi:hypothetical protein
VGIAIAVIVVRNVNAPVVDVIIVDPWTHVVEMAVSLRDSTLLHDDCAVNDAPAAYGR